MDAALPKAIEKPARAVFGRGIFLDANRRAAPLPGRPFHRRDRGGLGHGPMNRDL